MDGGIYADDTTTELPLATPMPDIGANTDAFQESLSVTPNPTQTPERTQTSSQLEKSTNSTASSNTVSKSRKYIKKVGKVSGVKVKKKKKGKLKITWKSTKNAYGYQVQVAKNRTFKKGKKTVICYRKAHTFFGLKRKQKYFVRVRAYCYNDSGKKKYGSWSNVKKVAFKNLWTDFSRGKRLYQVVCFVRIRQVRMGEGKFAILCRCFKRCGKGRNE